MGNYVCPPISPKGEVPSQSILSSAVYQNPFMAPNNFSEIHQDSYQTDTLTVAGPEKHQPSKIRKGIIQPFTGIAATIAFHSQGQIITIRTAVDTKQSIYTNTLLLIDPNTLRVLASQSLPPRAYVPDTPISFGGGSYFYLDNLDRTVNVTSNQQVRIYELRKNQFVLCVLYDLGRYLRDTDILNSVLPDSRGFLWFISHGAIVGFIDPRTGHVKTLRLRKTAGSHPQETITKSFATDENGGIFVVTDFALYRLCRSSKRIHISWRVEYDRGTRMKSGQNQQGSGTTCTCFNDLEGNQFVTIADNADPYMNILVFDRRNGALIAKQPVFLRLPCRNSCENSLIAVNHSVIVENNYGNDTIQSTRGKRVTAPGICRIDFEPKTGKSWITWVNYHISIPSVVTQLSVQNSLIYTYAKDSKTWYFASLDYNSGRIKKKVPIPLRNQQLANNFYGGIGIGPNETVYVGVLGGMLSWR